MYAFTLLSLQAQLEDEIRQLLDVKDRMERELENRKKPGDDADTRKQLAKLKVLCCVCSTVYSSLQLTLPND